LTWLGRRLRSSLTYPDGSVVHYTYTARNQLKEIKRGSTVLVTYTYDLVGNRLTKELENGTNLRWLKKRSQRELFFS
jgi:uncharacterized protein RhaS with RHS repeats